MTKRQKRSSTQRPQASNAPGPLFELSTRFEEDDAALRKLSFSEGALGHHDSDYHNMWGLFLRIVRRAEAIDADPQAFILPTGGYDLKALDAWARLVDNGRKLLEGLNRMRNQDRMVLAALEAHTQSFAQGIAGPLGLELRELLEDLSGLPQASHVAARLRRLIDDGVVGIFRQAAFEAMARSRDEFKLH